MTERELPKEAIEFKADKQELSREEIVKYAQIAIEAIAGNKQTGESLTPENFQEGIDNTVLANVNGLPEELADKLGIEFTATNQKAEEILQQLKTESEPTKLADLQTELIYQYISLISQVQNQADRGFTPSLAKETTGMDCTLSAWSLKQKLEQANVPNIKFQFAYPSGHAAGFITDAAGRQLYVDAQNGFIAEVTTNQVSDENNPETAYPIYEITASKIIKPVTRPNGSDYIPKYMGVRQDGAFHTLGNFHMLINRESPVYESDVGKSFRTSLNNSREEWGKFELLVNKVAGGKVIQETKFEELSQAHHAEFEQSKLT